MCLLLTEQIWHHIVHSAHTHTHLLIDVQVLCAFFVSFPHIPSPMFFLCQADFVAWANHGLMLRDTVLRFSHLGIPKSKLHFPPATAIGVEGRSKL